MPDYGYRIIMIMLIIIEIIMPRIDIILLLFLVAVKFGMLSGDYRLYLNVWKNLGLR